ncbi:MAG: penicillin-binding protein activator [Gammaproteobacteria bacterium]|nr:penicillin-binding protein activator [Gammaproteobacteria bacterium]
MITKHRASASVLSLALLIAACGRMPLERLPVPEHRPTPREYGLRQPAAQQSQIPPMEEARRYAEAALSASPADQVHLRLREAEALYRAGQYQAAATSVKRLGDTSVLQPPETLRLGLLQARLALQENRPRSAVSTLHRVRPAGGVAPELLAEYYALLAHAYSRSDNLLGAVRTLLERGRYLTDPSQLTENTRYLWQQLQLLDDATLSEAIARVPPGSELAGWLDLSVLSNRFATQPQQLASMLGDWRQRYPGHRGEIFVRPLTLDWTEPGLSRVALLLPLSGRFAEAGRAVQDGFMAMHKANLDPGRPEVLVYDAGEDPALLPYLLRQAIGDGAQLVVGPLGRDAAGAAAALAGQVPVLFLGKLEGPAPLMSLQFGLDPEDEARDVARRAWLDGHRVATVLYPRTPRGQRIHQAFASEWQQLGGRVAASEGFRPSETDYSRIIMRLLELDASEARKDRLQSLLGTQLEFEPRRRHDIDFVFLVADPVTGRLVNPQLRFHRGIGLPVYSTSGIFSGQVSPIHDADLVGVRFPEMPWMLEQFGREQSIRRQLQGNWEFRHTQLDRLYGMGIDSYRLMAMVPRQPAAVGQFHLSGVTGSLSGDGQGRVLRRAVWARFERGAPVPLDQPTPELPGRQGNADFSDRPRG